MKDLPWDAPVFTKTLNGESQGFRIDLENPPFPPAVDVSIFLLESEIFAGSDNDFRARWTPGVGLYIRTDNGHEMSWQEMERDEARGVIRFGVL